MSTPSTIGSNTPSGIGFKHWLQSDLMEENVAVLQPERLDTTFVTD
jgi:hypothetical protein